MLIIYFDGLVPLVPSAFAIMKMLTWNSVLKILEDIHKRAMWAETVGTELLKRLILLARLGEIVFFIAVFTKTDLYTWMHMAHLPIRLTIFFQLQQLALSLSPLEANVEWYHQIVRATALLVFSQLTAFKYSNTTEMPYWFTVLLQCREWRVPEGSCLHSLYPGELPGTLCKNLSFPWVSTAQSWDCLAAHPSYNHRLFILFTPLGNTSQRCSVVFTNWLGVSAGLCWTG